jgi:hypothetical protein
VDQARRNEEEHGGIISGDGRKVYRSAARRRERHN